MQQDKSLFWFKRSWIFLTATAVTAKTPSTHTVIPFPTGIVVIGVQPHPGYTKGTRPSRSGGDTLSHAAKCNGSSRSSGESSLLTPLGTRSLHRTHAALPANPLSDGTSNFHLNPAGMLHWKQPVN